MDQVREEGVAGPWGSGAWASALPWWGEKEGLNPQPLQPEHGGPWGQLGALPWSLDPVHDLQCGNTLHCPITHTHTTLFVHARHRIPRCLSKSCGQALGMCNTPKACPSPPEVLKAVSTWRTGEAPHICVCCSMKLMDDDLGGGRKYCTSSGHSQPW